jgi:type I restriction enzyme S subunit
MSASVWKKTTFENIGSLAMCKRVFQSETKSEGEIPFFKIGTFGGVADAYISKKLFDEYRSLFSYPNKGDILISASGTIGRTVIFDGMPAYFQDSNIMWLSHNENVILNEFLYHLYKTIVWNLEGSTIKRLYTDNFKKIEICFPKSKKEQKHIADILSTCDTVIQNTQKTIDKYKAIKQGMMQDLFTRGLTKDGKLRPSYKDAPELYKESELGIIPKEWEVKTLGNCANKPEYGLNTPAVDYDGCIGYLRITDIDDDSHRFMKEGITSPLEFSEEYKLSKGDLVFARTGASVGKTYTYDSKDGNLYFAGFLIRFKILNSYCVKYIFYNTLLPRYKNWVICYSMRTGQPGINAEEFATYKLPIPLLGEQIEIAKRLSSIDSTIQKEEAILEKYKNIKTGLMARLLTPPKDAVIIDETEE